MSSTEESTLTILIADDSNSDRLLLSTIVKGLGHDVVMARDGVEAVDLFVNDKPDIVLMDALMPRMDGFEAASKIKSLSQTHFVPIIFLTSLKEDSSLVSCLESGGDDFLSKPYKKVVLEAKINAFQRMLSMHQTLQTQKTQIEDHNNHLIREQEVAKKIFDKVAHAGYLDASNIQYTLSPLSVFNGDVLFAGLAPSGNLMVLLGDFTGHGLGAAIGAMPLAQTFYSMVNKGFSMQEVLAEMNIKLKHILPVDIFCCSVMIDLDMRNKTVEVWSGGLPDCFLYNNTEKNYQIISSNHVPLGVLDKSQFSDSTQIFEMQNDDRFFIWSDGILEAENQLGERFGALNIQTVFDQATSSDTIFKKLNQSVAQFVGNHTPSDDISMVEVKMVDEGQFKQSYTPPSFDDDQGPVDWRLSYHLVPESLQQQNPLPQLLQMLLVMPNLRLYSGDIYTILSELYSNALEHGVLELDSKLKQSSSGFAQYYDLRKERLKALDSGYINFVFSYKGSAQSGLLTILVEDSGSGFDHKTYTSRESNCSEYHGRGLALLRILCHEINYLDNGNKIKVVYDCSLKPNGR